MKKLHKIKVFMDNGLVPEKGFEQNDEKKIDIKSRLTMFLYKYTIVWIVILTWIILYFLNDNFGTYANLTNVLRQAAFVGIGAIGMTFVIMGGGIDLSVSGILSLSAVIAVLLILKVGVLVGLLVALICGACLGIANGLVITKLNISPFIATLGMGYIYLAITFMITNQQVILVSSPAILNVGMGSLFGIPIPFIILVLCCLFCAFISKFTRYGRFVRSVGSSLKASKAAGVPVHRVTIFSYMILGLLTALSGIILSGYLSSAEGNMGIGYELDAIAAAVVGGTSLLGGKGTFLGTVAGSIFFAMISNALDLFGVESYWQYVATGLILIFAITLDGLKTRYQSR
jgi:ribose transport system permease protein